MSDSQLGRNLQANRKDRESVCLWVLLVNNCYEDVCAIIEGEGECDSSFKAFVRQASCVCRANHIIDRGRQQ